MDVSIDLGAGEDSKTEHTQGAFTFITTPVIFNTVWFLYWQLENELLLATQNVASLVATDLLPGVHPWTDIHLISTVGH